MPKILVLGAGFSSPFLIQHLLDHAHSLDARVTVADLNPKAAEKRVGGHELGRAIGLDLRSEAGARELDEADLVVNLLPPKLQPEVARRCVDHSCHMVSASYRFKGLEALGAEAKEKGLAILTEMGLDPGLDLMSAQAIIDDIHGRGGTVERFVSYGGGLPEPSFDGNPLRYCITWNPRNVAMAAEAGAQFLKDGQIRMQPWPRVFSSAWQVEVPGLGLMDGYANRDSMAYRSIHGIENADTLIRGTLRYPGYCRIWDLIVRLGLPNEHLEIAGLDKLSWVDWVSMYLPDPVDSDSGGSNTDDSGSGDSVEDRTAALLGVKRSDPAFQALEALGLFSQEVIGELPGNRPADALVSLLQRRLPLPSGVRDMVVLHHEFDADFGDRRQKILSTFIHYGDPKGHTAMATTVGMPAALGARMLLDGRLERRGCLFPTDEDVFRPVLGALETEGLRFHETAETVPAS